MRIERERRLYTYKKAILSQSGGTLSLINENILNINFLIFSLLLIPEKFKCDLYDAQAQRREREKIPSS
jgi:hypothetical protein